MADRVDHPQPIWQDRRVVSGPVRHPRGDGIDRSGTGEFMDVGANKEDGSMLVKMLGRLAGVRVGGGE
jgi:hypothetical protein